MPDRADFANSRPTDHDPALGGIVLDAGRLCCTRRASGGRHLQGWYTFFLCQAGEARRVVNGIPYVHRPGQLMCLQDGFRHTYAIGGPPSYDHRWVRCSGPMIPGLATWAGFTADRVVIDVGTDARIPMLMQRILDVLRARQPGYLDEAFAVLVHFCLAVRRLGSPTRADPLLKALDHAEQGMEACAAACALSASQYRRRFRAQYGISPQRMVQRRRITQAQDLLLGGADLDEVARQVGMHDTAYLCRMFRREVGMPPGRWRDQLLGL